MTLELRMPERPHSFVGRKQELDIISDRLRWWGHETVIKIMGPGGVGKTSLAREVVHRESLRLTPLWVSFKEASQEPQAFREVFNRAFIDKAIRREKLAEALVVLDGVDEGREEALSDFLRVIFNYKRVAGLILTGRDRIPIRGEEIQLGALTSDAAREFLRKNTALPLPDKIIDSLVTKSEGSPLALSLISQLCRIYPADQVTSQLDGEIYTLKKPVASEIIQAVRPQIITFSGELVKELKKSPEKLHEVNSRQFEQIIADLFHDMGWDVELTKATRDGGRDILAYLNTGVVKLLCLIEAKKHRKDRPVGVQLVRNLYGTFCDEQANSAMLVTTSHFTAEAKKFQEKHKYQLSLKDYTDVFGWLANYNVK